MTQPALPRLLRTRRGMALLIVMAVVILLSTTAVTLHRTTMADWRMARRELDRIRLRAASTSGITLALEILAKDQRPYFWFPRDGQPPRNPDGTPRGMTDLEEALLRLGQSQELPLDIDGVPVRITITDEGARINLNRAPGIQLRRILEVLNESVPFQDPESPSKPEQEVIEELVDALEDWRDADSRTRPQGAEQPFYKEAEPAPYRPRNGPLLTLGELQLVRGFDSKVLEGTFDPETEVTRPGLLDFVTIHGILPRINVNEADPTVLASLPGLFESANRDQWIAAILAARPILSRGQIQQMAAVAPVPGGVSQALSWLDVRSDYLRIRATSGWEGRILRSVEVVVRKLPGGRFIPVSYREE